MPLTVGLLLKTRLTEGERAAMAQRVQDLRERLAADGVVDVAEVKTNAVQPSPYLQPSSPARARQVSAKTGENVRPMVERLVDSMLAVAPPKPHDRPRGATGTSGGRNLLSSNMAPRSAFCCNLL